MRTHGRPDAARAGNPTTLSSTMTSGPTSSKISRSLGSTYFAPSMSAWNVGAMNSPSCSSVDLRKTGEVSRMKSIQNCPGISGTSGGGPRRMSRSSKPLASRVPANDSSTTNTTRWPRARSTCADPDAVVRRAVGALGEEDDRAGVRHMALPLRIRPRSSPTREAIRSAALQDGTEPREIRPHRPITSAPASATAPATAMTGSSTVQRISR